MRNDPAHPGPLPRPPRPARPAPRGAGTRGRSRAALLTAQVAPWLLVAMVTAAVPAARGEGIVDVLHRSQAQRLAQVDDAARGVARPEAVAVIEASFQRLLAAVAPPAGDTVASVPPAHAPLAHRVRLKVVRIDSLAETLQGHVIVVDEHLADLPEGERLFVLAHELGHVALNHWATLGRLYQQHVPAEVMRPQTDAVADLLGREASALAHHHEFAADAYGLRALQRLGYGEPQVVGLFMRLGLQRDTATHPGTRKRLALLRTPE